MGKRVLGFLLALLLVVLLISTSEASESQVEMYHLFLNLVDDNTIEVQEQVVFQAPFAGTVINFTLPDGVHTIRGSQGEVQIDGNKLQISGLPVEVDSIAFSYQISLDEAPHVLINKTLDYDTQGFYVIFPQGDLKVSGSELQDGGTQTMGDKEYQLMQRENLSAGTVINLAVVRNYEDTPSGSTSVFSRVPSPDFHSPAHIRFWRQSPFAGMDAHLFLGLLIVIPLLAIIFYVRGRKKSEQAVQDMEQSEEDVFLKLVAREKALKQKIKDLELQKRAEQISEENYSAKREVYKKKLVEVRLKLRKFTG